MSEVASIEVTGGKRNMSPAKLAKEGSSGAQETEAREIDMLLISQASQGRNK